MRASTRWCATGSVFPMSSPTSASGTTSLSASGVATVRSRSRLVGKYVKLQDAYLSVHEALKHAGIHTDARARPVVDAEE